MLKWGPTIKCACCGKQVNPTFVGVQFGVLLCEQCTVRAARISKEIGSATCSACGVALLPHECCLYRGRVFCKPCQKEISDIYENLVREDEEPRSPATQHIEVLCWLWIAQSMLD